MSILPHDAEPKADILGALSELTDYTFAGDPGNLRWLRSASGDCDRWLRITLSYYDPLELTTHEARHLIFKVRGYLGARPDGDGEATLLWDGMHAKILRTFAAWLPTQRQRWYREYLRSEHWKTRRMAALRARGFICEDCGNEATEVHHLSYERLGEEWPEDLLIVCSDCHRTRHGKTLQEQPL